MNLSQINDLSVNTQAAFRLLATHARSFGIDLKIASGFRSIARQTAIWNRKSEPSFPLRYENSDVTAGDLTQEQWLSTVMRWSAVPGLSRHHWGTDIDVFDQLALPDGYELQLTPDEYSSDGIFCSLHNFLNEYVDANSKSLFFRPYRSLTNGVAPEAWHLSYIEEAAQILDEFTIDDAFATVPFDELFAGQLVKERFESIYHEYVMNIDAPI